MDIFLEFEQDSLNFTQYFKMEREDTQNLQQSPPMTIESLREQTILLLKDVIINLSMNETSYFQIIEQQAVQHIQLLFDNYQQQQSKNLEGEKSVQKQQEDVYKKKSRQKRGPYKRYSSQTKEKALSRLSEGISIKTVSREMKIPMKNLKRWIVFGSNRRKGGGRKRIDPVIESNLYDWCVQEEKVSGHPVTRVMIKQKALELSRFPRQFKASKGWTDKFVKNFNLKKKFIQESQSGQQQNIPITKKERKIDYLPLRVKSEPLHSDSCSVNSYTELQFSSFDWDQYSGFV